MNSSNASESLPERCLDAAIEVISTKGLEALSLRDVARRLGVSHQAPYKHFKSRDHLLAEIIRRCLIGFADHLDQSGSSDDAAERMEALGDAYIDYALGHPLEYRLMFGTPWPQIVLEEGIDAAARASFDVLCGRLGAVRPDWSPEIVERHAMFVWSSMHGIASVLESGSMRYLGMSDADQTLAVEHVKSMIRATFTS